MSKITRREALGATALVVAAVSSGEAVAVPSQEMVPAWQAYIENFHYSSTALVFKRPEGMLIVERADEIFYFASPGKRLGGRAYFAPADMTVELETQISVPASLLDAALAFHTAHEHISSFDDIFESLE
jgi:hypothetical protein